MTYQYMVKGLTIVDGIPQFPGAHHVSVQIPGYFVAYGPPVNRRFPTLAVIYKDYLTGQCLVGAEQAVLDTIPGGETLDQIVAVNPADWGCWVCDTVGIDLGDGPELLSNQVTITTDILSTMSTILPVVLAPILVAIGGKPSAPCSLGDFSVQDLEASTTWIGNHHL